MIFVAAVKAESCFQSRVGKKKATVHLRPWASGKQTQVIFVALGKELKAARRRSRKVRSMKWLPLRLDMRVAIPRSLGGLTSRRYGRRSLCGRRVSRSGRGAVKKVTYLMDSSVW